MYNCYPNCNHSLPNVIPNISYLEAKRREEEAYQDSRELRKTEAKAMIHTGAKLYEKKEMMELRKKAEEERKGIYDEIAVDNNGVPSIITRNLSMAVSPREITNMRVPKLYIASRYSYPAQTAFILECQVAQRKQTIYFAPQKVGSGTYLLGKLAAAGINIFAQPAKAKDYARRLLGVLVENGTSISVPDEAGWIETEDGKFFFVKDGEQTWKEIMKQI